MATKAELQEEVNELQKTIDDVKETLGVTETEEVLEDIKTRIENAEIELPDDDELPELVEGLAGDSYTLGAVKEALEEAGFELPPDEELADAISEYDFTDEENDGENGED